MLSRAERANIVMFEAFRALDERFIDGAIAAWDNFRYDYDGPLPTYEDFLREYFALSWYAYLKPIPCFPTICEN